MSGFGGGWSDLERALGYPYPRPDGSFLFVSGDALPYTVVGADPLGPESTVSIDGRAVPVPDALRRLDATPTSGEARTAVIGYGSNAAPLQLRFKYREARTAVVIPTIRADLPDTDVVYAPLVSYYGSIPATIARSPGVTAEAWVQWLDPEQLELMHISEGRGQVYDYGEFREPRVRPEGAWRPDRVSVYVARGGSLVDAAGPIPLAEIPATGRKREPLTQEKIQRHAQALLGDPGPLAAFVQQGIESRPERERRGRELSRRAEAPNDPRFRRDPGRVGPWPGIRK